MNDSFDLHPALDAERRVVQGPIGPLSYYRGGPGPDESDTPPLLLIHSVNAAASAYEIKPLFDHYATHRPVVALDLPGYGFSARRAIRYTPREMTDALHVMLDTLLADGLSLPADAIALSLSSEFLARAVLERPNAWRTLGLISPTGFAGDEARRGEPGSTRGKPWLYKSVTASERVGRNLFAGLTSRQSIRYFLQKTWGRKQIDEGAFEYAHATAHQPGAHHAPFSFLSGYLFSDDISDVYDALDHPVWMGHGNRGDFTDYRRKIAYGDKPNWQIDAYETGALPQFEILDQLAADYDGFVARATARPGAVPAA